MGNYLVESLSEVAVSMNHAGTLVDPERFRYEVDRWYPDTKEQFLDLLHGDVLYGQWVESEADLFWRCNSPLLMKLPKPVQMTFLGYRISLKQPLLYEAALTAGRHEWLECYNSGQDLLQLVAGKLHMNQWKALVAIYRYMYGGLDAATTWQVEATFPWLAALVTRFETFAMEGHLIRTRLGTILPQSLFPRASLGRYLTQTIKDVIRTGVLTSLPLPSFISPECVVSPALNEHIIRLWQDYGFMVQVEKFEPSTPSLRPTIPVGSR
jgi:hypothetical protein